MLRGSRRPAAVHGGARAGLFLHEAVWTGRAGGRRARAALPRRARRDHRGVGRRVCVIGGVDLAHVGPRFGDRAPNTPASARGGRARRPAMLDAVMAGDAAGFYARWRGRRRAPHLRAVADLRLSPRAARRAGPPPVRYRQWPDPEGAVTFCAAAFADGRPAALRSLHLDAAAPAPSTPTGPGIHEGVEVTHAGILANLREGLQRGRRGPSPPHRSRPRSRRAWTTCPSSSCASRRRRGPAP